MEKNKMSRLSVEKKKKPLKQKRLMIDKNKKKKKFVNKILDYLTYDSYMYSPLIISSPPSDSLTSKIRKSLHAGPGGFFRKISSAILNKRIGERKEETREQALPEDLFVKEQHPIQYDHQERDLIDQLQFERQEMVKHMVHQSALSAIEHDSPMKRFSTDSPMKKVSTGRASPVKKFSSATEHVLVTSKT